MSSLFQNSRMRDKNLPSFPRLVFPHGFWYHFLSFPLGLCFIIHLLSFLCSNPFSMPAPSLGQISTLDHFGEINCTVIVLRWIGERRNQARESNQKTFSRIQVKSKGNLLGIVKGAERTREIAGFVVRMALELVVIYDFALFSHCFYQFLEAKIVSDSCHFTSQNLAWMNS